MKASKKLFAIVLTAMMVLSLCAVLPAMGNELPTVTRTIFKDFNPTTTAYPGDELIVVINCSEAPQDSDDMAYLYDSLLDSGNWSTSIISIMPADSVLLNVTGQTAPPALNPYVFVLWTGDPAIEAGETVRVQYRITVPDDAEGDYYFDGDCNISTFVDIGGSDHVTVITGEEKGSVVGQITYACNGTDIEGADVKLLTHGGVEVDSATTDANGDYEFTDVTPGNYFVNISKTRFWDNSTDVAVSAGVPTTADMMLWLKGDLNNDGISAGEDDLVLMFKAYLKFIAPDWKYDLDEDGEFASEDDLVLMFKAYLGFIVLE